MPRRRPRRRRRSNKVGRGQKRGPARRGQRGDTGTEEVSLPVHELCRQGGFRIQSAMGYPRHTSVQESCAPGWTENLERFFSPLHFEKHNKTARRSDDHADGPAEEDFHAACLLTATVARRQGAGSGQTSKEATTFEASGLDPQHCEPYALHSFNWISIARKSPGRRPGLPFVCLCLSLSQFRRATGRLRPPQVQPRKRRRAAPPQTRTRASRRPCALRPPRSWLV